MREPTLDDEDMSTTSFLSSIVGVIVGVPLGFDGFVKLIPLIDTDVEISSGVV